LGTEYWLDNTDLGGRKEREDENKTSLHNVELHNLYFSPNIITTVAKSRRMIHGRDAWHPWGRGWLGNPSFLQFTYSYYFSKIQKVMMG
jgi:hypothetical protein